MRSMVEEDQEAQQQQQRRHNPLRSPPKHHLRMPLRRTNHTRARGTIDRCRLAGSNNGMEGEQQLRRRKTNGPMILNLYALTATHIITT